MGLIELLSAIAGSSASTLALRWAYMAWQKRSNFRKLLKQVDHVNRALQTICNYTSADRAQIIVAHNGGGVPRLGNHIKTSVLYEHVNGADVKRLKNGWQDVLVCSDHTRLLMDVSVSGYRLVQTTDLASSPLSDMYVSNDVVSSRLYWVGQEKRRWYYLELHFSDSRTLTPKERDLVREELVRLRKLFKGGK